MARNRRVTAPLVTTKFSGGRSGATFAVTKRANGSPDVLKRLRAQWVWLQKPRRGIVEVGPWVDSGYEMELLVPAVATLAERLKIIGEILAMSVWTEPGARVDWNSHQRALDARDAPEWLRALSLRLGPALESCDTHGDPTAENLMLRPTTGEFVLVDPVPDASFGTGERAADLGKMLQSAVGYEDVRSGTAPGFRLGPEVDVVRALARDGTEWARARYWLGVWLLGIQKYQTPRVAEIVKNELERLRPFIEGKPAVFLDRDGTINKTIGGIPPRDVTELEVLSGAPEACTLLREAGYILVIVTNQSELAYGTLSRASVDEVNDYVQVVAGAVGAFVCPHGRDEGCLCRKPQPGMIHAASKSFDIDLTESWIVGDKEADVGAGNAANLRGAILIPRDEAGALLRAVKETILAC